MLDAHAHLDKYDADQIDQVLAAIERESILTLSVSVDPSSFLRAEAIAARSMLVIPSFGIHPEHAPLFVGSLDQIVQLADRSPMIGEIGLDHRFVSDVADHGPQREVFAALVQIAKAQEKVINVHCVGAEQDALDLMTSFGIDRAIIHWYSGPVDVLADMIAAGYWFTIGVEVLHSEHIRRIARLVPAGQLLTETDNPGGRLWLTGRAGPALPPARDSQRAGSTARCPHLCLERPDPSQLPSPHRARRPSCPMETAGRRLRLT